MAVQKICDVYIRVEPGGRAVLLFTPLRPGGEHERDSNGFPVCFTFPLDLDDAGWPNRSAAWRGGSPARRPRKCATPSRPFTAPPTGPRPPSSPAGGVVAPPALPETNNYPVRMVGLANQ
jgi:hypothetical protein